MPLLQSWTTHCALCPHSVFKRHDCVCGPPAHDDAQANVLPVKQQTSPAAQSAASSHWKSHWPEPLHVVDVGDWQTPAAEPLAQHASELVGVQFTSPVALAPLQSTSPGKLA